ncbi:MAG: hypothetical protein ABI914_07100 [Acidobacteriota bacterium]
MRKKLLMVSLAACCAIVVSSSVSLAAENWVGTWKLDLAKSKYSPGPAPKSFTLKFEATPDGIRFTGDGVGANGKPSHTTYVSRFDGKEVPYEGNQDADTASPMKIDDNSYSNTWKKGGKATITGKILVAADGKTMTITQSGTNAKGEAVNHSIVYNKQ